MASLCLSRQRPRTALLPQLLRACTASHQDACHALQGPCPRLLGGGDSGLALGRRSRTPLHTGLLRRPLRCCTSKHGRPPERRGAPSPSCRSSARSSSPSSTTPLWRLARIHGPVLDRFDEHDDPVCGVHLSTSTRHRHCLYQEPEKVKFYLRLGQSKPIYKAFNAIGNSSEWDSLSDARKRVVEGQIKDVVLGGVALEDEQREKFNQIQQELEKLTEKFSTR